MKIQIENIKMYGKDEHVMLIVIINITVSVTHEFKS